MFCPKCATQNIDGASFCRACGANISLIPQALSGQLPQPPEDPRRFSRRLRRRQPSIEEGIRQLATGMGFLFVSLAVAEYAPAGRIWWFWMLIPAFTLLGKGIAEIIQVKNNRTTLSATENQNQIAPVSTMGNLQHRSTAELMPPVPSVTEGTTRHLGAEAATRHFDSLESKPS